MKNWISAAALAAAIGLPAAAAAQAAQPGSAEIDAYAEELRAREGVPGMALAVIENGEVTHLAAYGDRKLEPHAALDADTVMYGASLTKFVFAAYVMQLAEDGLVDLDRPIGEYFDRPLPEYEEWADLAGDERWRELTLRLLLSHQTGWANFRFFPPEGGFDPDAKLKFYLDPGTRYAYSGEGFILAQRAVAEVIGGNVGEDMQARLFDPLGMSRTSMIWREDFRPNFASGYTVDGEDAGHNMQDNTRASGSMDTTIRDFAAFVAAFQRGEVVSDASRDEMLSPQIAIASAHQFPPLDPADNPANAEVNLSGGLGVEVWDAPDGRGFVKGGHNEKTDNMLTCVDDGRRCVALLMNTAKGDRVYPQLIEYVLGGTDFPWAWKYSALEAEE